MSRHDSKARRLIRQRLSIRSRLALTLATVALLVGAGLLLVFHFSFRSGFVAYLNEVRSTELAGLAERFAVEFDSPADWEALMASPRSWRRAQQDLRSFSARGHIAVDGARPDHRPPGRHSGGALSTGLALFTADGNKRFGPSMPDDAFLRLPVTIDNQVVAFIGQPLLKAVDSRVDKSFVESQTRLFAFWTVVAMLISAGLAWPVATFLLRRLAALSVAVRALAERRYDTRVEDSGVDELSRLAQDINVCASALNSFETKQRRWLVDISHELRTPLAILTAEIEAIIDGVRPLSMAAVQSLQHETHMLRELVDSLHQLSMLDQQKSASATADPGPVISLSEALADKLDSLSASLSSASIELVREINEQSTLAAIEPELFDQILNNLWQNTHRYTDAPGTLSVSLTVNTGLACLRWEDSAPGLDPESYEYMFDRLWRGESSRNRASGGSGLGLAICRAIVLQHGGSMTAGASELGGVAIEIVLPLAREGVFEGGE